MRLRPDTNSRGGLDVLPGEVVHLEEYKCPPKRTDTCVKGCGTVLSRWNLGYVCTGCERKERLA